MKRYIFSLATAMILSATVATAQTAQSAETPDNNTASTSNAPQANPEQHPVAAKPVAPAKDYHAIGADIAKDEAAIARARDEIRVNEELRSDNLSQGNFPAADVRERDMKTAKMDLKSARKDLKKERKDLRRGGKQ